MAGCFRGEAGFSQGAHNAGGLFKGPELTGSTLETMGGLVSRRGGPVESGRSQCSEWRPRAGARGPGALCTGLMSWKTQLRLPAVKIVSGQWITWLPGEPRIDFLCPLGPAHPGGDPKWPRRRRTPNSARSPGNQGLQHKQTAVPSSPPPPALAFSTPQLTAEGLPWGCLAPGPWVWALGREAGRASHTHEAPGEGCHSLPCPWAAQTPVYHGVTVPGPWGVLDELQKMP